MVLTIAAAVFVFGLLVLVHELGHFVTAKLTGMRVDEFAIGFGPQLLAVKRGETVYSLRAVPLGGFNNIAGMDPEAEDDAGERGYARKSVWARMLVILAGSAMNFLLPVFLYWGVFFFSGVATPSTEPVLGMVLPDRPAAQAGLLAGDRVLSVDGAPVGSWQEFASAVQQGGEGTSHALVISRDGEEQELSVSPAYDKTSERAMIGVMSSATMEHPGAVRSAQLAVQKTGSVIYMMVYELYKIILKLSGAELAGPIGVAQMAGQVAQMGFVPLLNFTAFLSLNLAIINLLPIPALDGGHFVGLCVEAVIGRPMGPRFTYYAQRVGIALLLLLMVFATKNDVVRVFLGG